MTSNSNTPASTKPGDRLTIPQAIARAYAHWEAGQAQQAEALARQVLAIDPAQIDCLHLLGLLAHAYNKPELALEYLRKACAPPHAPGMYCSNLAEICRQQGLLDEAERAGRTAVARAPEHAAAWNNLGIILQEAGRLDEALACLQKIVALEPDNHDAHSNLANTLQLCGRLEKAREEYERAIALHPRHADAHCNLAHLLCKLQHYDAAAHHAQKAIDIAPQLIEAYTNFAEIELARQHPAAAMQKLDALLHFAPQHPATLIARARVLNMLGRTEEAHLTAETAVTIAPDNPGSHNVLGEVLLGRDRLDEALAAFERAAQIPGIEQRNAYRNLARVWIRRGEKEKAAQLLADLLDRHPQDQDALRLLAEIKVG